MQVTIDLSEFDCKYLINSTTNNPARAIVAKDFDDAQAYCDKHRDHLAGYHANLVDLEEISYPAVLYIVPVNLDRDNGVFRIEHKKVIDFKHTV